jgi:hypothetical protein
MRPDYIRHQKPDELAEIDEDNYKNITFGK